MSPRPGDGTDWDTVIVAGGRASRLDGADKPGLQVGGRPIIEQVADAAAGDRLIVVGPRYPGLAGAIVTREQPPGGGPVAALAAGLAHVRSEYLAVLAGDLPFLRAATVRRLREAIGGHEAAVLLDAGGREQWLCAMWRTAALRTRIATGPARDRSLRSVYAAASVTGVHDRIRAGGVEPWFDVDTPEDLDQARARATDRNRTRLTRHADAPKEST